MSSLSGITSGSGHLEDSYDLAPFPIEIWTYIAELSPRALDVYRQLSLVNKALRQAFLPSLFESITVSHSSRKITRNFAKRTAFLSSDTISGAIKKCWLKTQNAATRKEFDLSGQPLFLLIAPNLQQVTFESITFRLDDVFALSTLTNIQSVKFVNCDILETVPFYGPQVTLALPRLQLEGMTDIKLSQFCFWLIQPDDLLSLAYSRCTGTRSGISTQLDPSPYFPNLKVLRADPVDLEQWWNIDRLPRVILPALIFLDLWYATASYRSLHLLVSPSSPRLQQPSLPSLRALSCGQLPAQWMRTYAFESKITHLRTSVLDFNGARNLLELLVNDPGHTLKSLSLELPTLPQQMRPLIARLGDRGVTSLELKFTDAIPPQQLKEIFQAILDPNLDTEEHVLPKTLKSCYLAFRVDISQYLDMLRPLVSSPSWSTSHPDLGIMCIAGKSDCEPICYDHQLREEIVGLKPSWMREMAVELGIEDLIDTDS